MGRKVRWKRGDAGSVGGLRGCPLGVRLHMGQWVKRLC